MEISSTTPEDETNSAAFGTSSAFFQEWGAIWLRTTGWRQTFREELAESWRYSAVQERLGELSRHDLRSGARGFLHREPLQIPGKEVARNTASAEGHLEFRASKRLSEELVRCTSIAIRERKSRAIALEPINKPASAFHCLSQLFFQTQL